MHDYITKLSINFYFLDLLYYYLFFRIHYLFSCGYNGAIDFIIFFEAYKF